MEKSKNLRFFVLMTYVFFIVLFLITGVVTTFITDKARVLFILKTICARSSFFVLMIWFKKFYPHETRKSFFKNLFRDKLDWKLFWMTIGGSLLIFLLSLVCVSLVKHMAIIDLVEISAFALLLSFFINLISGPIGEEPGWRGYFLTTLIPEKGILKASIINGLLRGFWHLPLRLIMGYIPGKLIVYTLFFVISIVSANIIMGYMFTKNRNLIQCICIHQMTNFLFGAVFIGDMIDIIVPFALFYMLVAIIVSFVFNKK